MLRFALALLLLLPATAHAGRYLPAIAIAIATTPTTPQPAPPAPSGICTNCNGTGKLGDGTVFVPCPVCGGDGKLTTAGRTEADSSSVPRKEAPAVVPTSLTPDQQPTPMHGVATVLWALGPRPDEVLVDFGCGFDARMLITACQQYGTRRAIGVEIDPVIAESARRHVAAAGLSDRIEIITGDATTTDVQADIGVAYLFEDTLGQLRPRIERLKRFASYVHQVPGLSMQRAPSATSEVYVWSQPRPVQVQLPAAATWGGRTYTRPVCNSRSCSMCNAIRQELATPRYAIVQQPTETPQTAITDKPRGRWVTQKICHGRGVPCTYRRVWVAE